MLLYLVLGICASAHGMAFKRQPPSRPEIDPSMMVSALTLLAGTLAVLRVRRNK
jgi:hypothetical protein